MKDGMGAGVRVHVAVWSRELDAARFHGGIGLDWAAMYLSDPPKQKLHTRLPDWLSRQLMRGMRRRVSGRREVDLPFEEISNEVPIVSADVSEETPIYRLVDLAKSAAEMQLISLLRRGEFRRDISEGQIGHAVYHGTLRRGRRPSVKSNLLGEWLEYSLPGAEELRGWEALKEVGVADGDLLFLHLGPFVRRDPSQEHVQGSHLIAPVSDSAQLIKWLKIAEGSPASCGLPRLWGVLLYTGLDADLAVYVRTHFDDLNALSGAATRVFVVETRIDGRAARLYWRSHLEPELYRRLAATRWLQWTPYAPQAVYEIASLLGLEPEMLPCLVFFQVTDGEPRGNEKIVFRIEGTSPSYFRSLFGEINRILHSVPSGTDAPPEPSSVFQDRADPERLFLPDVTPDQFQALDTLARQAAPQGVDAAAFSRVAAAQDAIRAALMPVPAALVDEALRVQINNSRVVVVSGDGVTENFYFQGENTTFINRPTDTVVRDFQNNYHSVPGAHDMTQLLQLVLNSRDLDEAQREEAAQTVHVLARASAVPEPDVPQIRTRIERLRELMTGAGADIAQPALAILASLAAMFGG